MRISDWSSDVCSSDLARRRAMQGRPPGRTPTTLIHRAKLRGIRCLTWCSLLRFLEQELRVRGLSIIPGQRGWPLNAFQRRASPARSEEHTSELQSLMRISYAVFCLKKKNKQFI